RFGNAPGSHARQGDAGAGGPPGGRDDVRRRRSGRGPPAGGGMSATSASRPAQRQDAPGTLADELRQRFGDIDLPQYPASETIRVQLRHRSVRAFLPEKIPQDALDLVLMAAQAASHSSNLQAWSVVVVEDADRRRRVCEAIGGMDFINQA